MVLFFASIISADTTIYGHKECLIHCHGIMHNLVSDQGIYFTVSGLVSLWANPHGFNCSYCKSYYSEVAELREWPTDDSEHIFGSKL